MSAPYKSLYVIGANILYVLRSSDLVVNDPLELFDVFKTNNRNISLAYFNFGLDWLYMIGAIELTDSGNITLCN